MHDNLTSDIVPLIRVKGDANPKTTGEHLSLDRITLDYIGEYGKMPEEIWDPESPK